MAARKSTLPPKTAGEATRRAKISAYLNGLTLDQRAQRAEKIASKMRGRRNWWLEKPDSRLPRTTRAWAVELTKHINECQLARIGYCLGPLDRAHIDQNPTNNALENIMVLCRSHHRLVDLGRIDPANPKMPTVHVYPNGRRRYQHG